jgi:hypothetical protein
MLIPQLCRMIATILPFSYPALITQLPSTAVRYRQIPFLLGLKSTCICTRSTTFFLVLARLNYANSFTLFISCLASFCVSGHCRTMERPFYIPVRTIQIIPWEC